MTAELPEPKSRKESYLAKAAGMDVTVPENPESRLEQYLAAIAEGGGSALDGKVDKSSFVYDSTTQTLTITIE